MLSDSITSASIHAGSAPKDLSKKKRTNRSAKLKQCKLDARREQWLSQVKNKGGKEQPNGGAGRICVSPVDVHDERGHSMGNLELRSRREEHDGSIHHDSDFDSPSNSPTSSSSLLSSNKSLKNYSGSRSSSSSSSSVGCCSGSITDEEGDDGCLDDWEAVADALAVNDKQHSPITDPQAEDELQTQCDLPLEMPNRAVSEVDNLKQECGPAVQRAPTGSRAWRPDDAFRPQSLPNLSKQHSFPMSSDRHYSHGAVSWTCKSVMSAPMPCPICYEDLDFTDSSFLPCLCGFRLCLFCHKRILEEDGRCPGCRKPYHHDPVEGEASLNGGSLTFRLTRSCSMITRS